MDASAAAYYTHPFSPLQEMDNLVELPINQSAELPKAQLPSLHYSTMKPSTGTHYGLPGTRSPVLHHSTAATTPVDNPTLSPSTKVSPLPVTSDAPMSSSQTLLDEEIARFE